MLYYTLLSVYRLHYSVDITFVCTEKPKTLCGSLYSDICFIAVVQNSNISKVCTYMIFWKRQNYKDRKQIGGMARRWVLGGADYKRAEENFVGG